MSNLKKHVVLSCAMVAALTLSSTAMAQCNSCGWPNGDCCGGSCLDQMRAEYQQFKADCDLICKRNAAWPLPFSCWDREAYYAVMNQQYATGTQVAHTLTSEYFDANTNELNRAGESRVAWIVQNAPAADKRIFVYQDQSGPAIDQRVASVRNTVDRWYSHLGNVEIATSNLLPNSIPATYQNTIMQAYSESQPQPVIPIATGQGIQQAVGGN
jgi:hypothetical protein